MSPLEQVEHLSAIDQVKHLVPKAERPDGFEESEKLILEEILRKRLELRDSILQLTAPILPQRDEMMEHQAA